ncbi:hypothetical protein DPMN_046732 [Dreissena polymorpha]|uniref:Uncharacterized protein n=1 Tax=Dreissena polymorpha TaxID=45954 RepID=A0A9D4D8E7_DREPO|nr:hypothetical protein DPMN_046732 [Dreissena polymorpha]
MSKVLDDIGAGKDTVMERRKTFLERECMHDIDHKLWGRDVNCFHFGSQSEGTTIPGLHSDIDLLFSDNDVSIMRVWGDWEAGIWNYMMLQDDITPPHQYLLEDIRQSTA